MKAIFAIAIIAALFASTSAGLDPKFLRASGNSIVCGNGKEITLNGVNFGGFWVFEKWMSPLDESIADDRTMIATLTQRFGHETATKLIKGYHDAWISEEDIKRVAARGMNVIRMPIYDLNFMNEDGVWLSDAPFAELDRLVNLSWKYGIYTIIDMHGVPASQNGEEHSGRTGKAMYWTNSTAQALTVKLWDAVARHYAGHPGVAGYDLLNEPTGASGKTQWAGYDKLYKVVRAADPDHIIFIEAVWGWDDLPKPSTYGWENVVYEFHHYEWGKDESGQIAGINKIIKNFNNHKAWSVPCYIGEFNFFQYESAWKYGIEQFNTNGISWTIWSYKAAHGSNDDSWGVYDLKSGQDKPEVPTLASDSADEIQRKWGLWTTENAFELNGMLDRTLISRNDKC